MFEFIVVVVLANLIMLAVLYVLRHVIAIRAPVLLLAVGISILYCILYPFLAALVSYPQVLYLYVFLVVAGAGSLYFIESRFFTVRELKESEMTRMSVGEALEAIKGNQIAVSGGKPALDWQAAGRMFSRRSEDTGTAREGPVLSVQEENTFVQEDKEGLSHAAGMAAGPEFTEVPVEDAPALADKIVEVHITADGVAALLKAADTGELKGAEEDVSFYTEDEIASGEEGLEPADVQVESVPGRDDLVAGEITATLEGLDAAGPVEAVEEAWFTGVDGSDSDINIEELLPVEEEPVLVCEEEAGLTEGLEPETADMAAGPEPAEILVEDSTGRDDAAAGEITDTLEGLYTAGPVETVEETEYERADVLEEAAAGTGEEYWDTAGLIEDSESDYVPVEEFRELDDGFSGREVAAAGMAGPEVLPYRATEEQSAPGDDINSLVAGAFDKLASGDGAGAVDSFFRALKLGPPPRLAVLLCARISSIYSSQGLNRQALAVMEMLEVVWGPMLDDGDREGITTIIIRLRGEV